MTTNEEQPDSFCEVFLDIFSWTQTNQGKNKGYFNVLLDTQFEGF
jgi:hypothetical protein